MNTRLSNTRLGPTTLALAAMLVGAPLLGLVSCSSDKGGKGNDDCLAQTGQPCSGPVSPAGCGDYDPVGLNLYWGDLHVHTTHFFDSYWFQALNGPDEAYRYSRGEPVSLVCDDFEVGCATSQLDRPLDFVGLSDHAEYLDGFSSVCNNGDPGNGCPLVGSYISLNVDQFIAGDTGLDPELIGRLVDTPPAETVWAKTVEETDANDDPCSFTTFAGYEYSANSSGQMLHRNVFFNGTEYPKAAVSMLDTLSEWELFDRLEAECGDVEGCDYITIPHNSNLSDGRMFLPLHDAPLGPGRDGGPLTPEDAALRAKSDVLFEVFQHKGQSECMPGLGFDLMGGDEVDAACGFELVKPFCETQPNHPDCRTTPNNLCTQLSNDPGVEAVPANCTAPTDHLRAGMAEGLEMRESLGVNPYKMGFVGATDTHNGTPGNVREDTFRGHGGILDSSPGVLLGGVRCPIDQPDCEESDREFDPQAFSFNPGGLTAVWAAENTRDAIWAALRARRTYATSGPRIRVRTYASFSQFPEDMCAQLQAGKTPVEAGEVAGVPMGSLLPDGGAGGAPQIVAWAVQDPGGERAGNPLERVQVVKVWRDADGPHSRVYDVAGSANGPPPSQDCSVQHEGRPEQLCGVFTDPDFDVSRDAFYYVRVLEQPSCRWSTHMCVKQGVDCSQIDPASGQFPDGHEDAGYVGCCAMSKDADTGLWSATPRFDTIQERAWTSPFWYEP